MPSIFKSSAAYNRSMKVSAQTIIPPAGNADSETSSGEATALKQRALEERLAQLGSLMVAYSGGVDSAFLAAAAHRVLGSRMIAVLADSPRSEARRVGTA